MENEDIEAVINDEPVVEKKQRKKFKEYYADPEFKKRHLEYVNEKIECTCGRSISRSNYSKHLKTPLHERRSKNKEQLFEEDDDVKELIRRLAEKAGIK